MPQMQSSFQLHFLVPFLGWNFLDHFVEESICLLLRARWFQGKTPAVEEVEEADFFDDLEDEEEYHLSRVVLGNRRFGESGFMSSGRAHARPAQPKPASQTLKHSHEKTNAPSTSAKKAQREAKKQEKENKEADKRAKRAAKRAEDATNAQTINQVTNDTEVFVSQYSSLG
eukprot:CAMPEP_0196582856 /NCGR_PEP_ID=MMETSP1081-20130531/40982_1 /TAXON_ID=36882 /ORGANISM="Pyramimonas amylifera, Strain CCMP720" /LENGTH=170 /DNA_ID=CAMNT_0041903563 /DNA_START=623 /DNA_END=1136 /DNA_ORIENTATION=+